MSNEASSWKSSRPTQPGNFLWRKGEGQPEYRVQGRMQDTLAWSDVGPDAEGRYLWRASVQGPAFLITVTYGIARLTGCRERFVVSCGHATSEEFEALRHTGQWAVVDGAFGY